MGDDILLRLTNQLRSKGVKGAKNMAVGLLKKRGQMDGAGHLTAKGRARAKLGPGGRAKDRAIKHSKNKHSPKDYTYNPSTNKAKLRKK